MRKNTIKIATSIRDGRILQKAVRRLKDVSEYVEASCSVEDMQETEGRLNALETEIHNVNAAIHMFRNRDMAC
jgi:hypothetical protein